MSKNSNFSRADFMSFFRDTEKLNELSVDDRLEVFCSILTGSSDFSAKLLNELLSDYGVGHLRVVEEN
ncbi:MAG: hypothetical protein EOM47_11925 [Bacteroidia bacterium]|nr:hypothetical protein [Bacteroidia bacterium]